MSPPLGDDAPTPSERMRALELKAQAIRARLVHAVDALDERRHRAIAVGRYAKGMAKPAALALLGVVGALGIGALAVRSVLRARRARTLSARASRAIQRLDLVPKPSIGSRVVEKVAGSILTLVATELVSRLAARLAVEHAHVPRALPAAR